jgi:hypothetical protein
MGALAVVAGVILLASKVAALFTPIGWLVLAIIIVGAVAFGIQMGKASGPNGGEHPGSIGQRGGGGGGKNFAISYVHVSEITQSQHLNQQVLPTSAQVEPNSLI